MRIYRELGSPSDKLLTTAGCDTKWEVELFTAALKEARACLAHRAASLSWPDAERAKFAITMSLRAGEAAPLKPYVDCAPADLVAQSTTCGAYSYRKSDDLERLAAAVKKYPDLLRSPSWREFPVQPTNPRSARWELHTDSERWEPCGMPGSALVSLREDPPGEYRIAGFAVTCLEDL